MKFGTSPDSRKTPRAGASVRPPRLNAPRGLQNRASGPILPPAPYVPAKARQRLQGAARRPDSERSERSRAVPLDTLAQPDQNASAKGRANLLKRARAKYLGSALAMGLADLHSPLERSYRNTVYCCHVLEQKAGKVRGKWCGNRWCPGCNRLRTARAIKRYLPEVQTWHEPQFVTVTRPTVTAADLPKRLDEMHADFLAIRRGIKRTDGLPFRALLKLECTPRVEENRFHPHPHIVIEGKAQAEAFVRRWLELNPDASPAAQSIKPCDSTSLRELFKYFTKLIPKADKDGERTIPVAMLDVIFRAMRGRRVFRSMGFTARTDVDENGELADEAGTDATERPDEDIDWEWVQRATDWIDLSTGQCLTGYTPKAEYRRIVESINPELPP